MSNPRQTNVRQPRRSPDRSAGFSLIELLVAVMLAIFLLGGLFAIIQSNKRAFTSQTTLSQQQDNERFAMTIVSEVLQSAGYFPDPTAQTSNALFTVLAPYTSAGQVVAGTSGGATGDTITVRYYGSPTTTVINCDGSQANVAQIYTNQFSVNTAGQLVCVMNGGLPLPLVDGVSRLDVLYGVTTQPNSTTTSIDTYFTAANMAAANWPNVVSVKFTITFNNALATSVAQQLIPLTRTVAII